MKKDHNKPIKNSVKETSRRNLLKGFAAVGWTTPVITSIVLPAHAQMSTMPTTTPEAATTAVAYTPPTVSAALFATCNFEKDPACTFGNSPDGYNGDYSITVTVDAPDSLGNTEFAVTLSWSISGATTGASGSDTGMTTGATYQTPSYNFKVGLPDAPACITPAPIPVLNGTLTVMGADNVPFSVPFTGSLNCP